MVSKALILIIVVAIVVLLVGISWFAVILVPSKFDTPQDIQEDETAIVFIDVFERVLADDITPVDGPFPLYVTPGAHQLTYANTGAGDAETTFSVRDGGFAYVSLTESQRYLLEPDNGALTIKTFPPDTTIEIEECEAITCTGVGQLETELAPGTYQLLLQNDSLNTEHAASLEVTAGETTVFTHTFIETVAAWKAWRQRHEDVLLSEYPRLQVDSPTLLARNKTFSKIRNILGVPIYVLFVFSELIRAPFGNE